jgi:hypothetical protein
VSPTPKRRRKAPAPDPFPERGLAELGLARGDQVRFRRNETERWKPATVARRERDGSVGLHDPKGASRAIPVACIEVRDTGPRGGVVWEPLPERAARTEQMALVAAAPAGEPRRPRPRPTTSDDPESTAATRSAHTEPAAAAPADPSEPVPPSSDHDHDHDSDPDDDGQLRLL